jgi:hypothetical protein
MAQEHLVPCPTCAHPHDPAAWFPDPPGEWQCESVGRDACGLGFLVERDEAGEVRVVDP